MRKHIAIFALVFVLFLASSVVAETISVTKEMETIVKDVASTKGVQKENIKEVEQVSFEELPEEITLQNIDDTNLALYKVDAGEDKPMYVITASETKFKKVVQKFTNKMMLSFGFAGEFSESGYLMSATGVLGDLEKGYAMMREGSITGMSTNLEVIEGTGEIEVIIYKSKDEIEFRNAFKVETPGIYTDYDTLSGEILNFQPGDVVSVYVNIPKGMVLKDINTLLELQTEN
jgi:hypothetical protein